MSENDASEALDFGKLAEVYRSVRRSGAPLRERLAIFDAAVRWHGAPFAAAYDELVARLTASGAGGGAPEAGDEMPGFLLPNADGALVSLDGLLKDGPIVLSLNRGHWCEYCGIELGALADHAGAIAEAGAKIVSIMPEKQQSLTAAKSRADGKIDFLSDIDNGHALSLGLAVWAGDRVRELYLRHNLRIDMFQGNDAWFLPIPATFVVGRDGRVAAGFVDADFRRRMDVEDILAALRSMNRGA